MSAAAWRAGTVPPLPPEPRSADPAGAARGWRHGLQLLLAGCVLVPLLLLLLWGERSWRAEWARAAEVALRNAEMVREQAIGVVNTQMAVLDHVSTLAAMAERDGTGPEGLHRQLAALDARLDTVLRLGVIDRSGRLLAASTGYPAQLDVSDRPYFLAVREGEPRIQMERVTLRQGGQDVVLMALRRPGEGFAGAVASIVPVEAFTDAFGRIAADPRASASLLGADGTLLVRHRPDAQPMLLPPDAPARQAISRAPSGVYEALALSDGITRIYGYSQVADLPLYANFGLPRSAVVESWLGGMMLVGALLLLTSLGGCTAVLYAARRMEAEADRRQLAEAERRADIQATLLRELHHRVKNSLMTVQSLIRMQAGVGARAAETLQRRVLALAQVHDLLHVSEMVSRLELSGFLRALCANPAIVPPGLQVAVDCEVEPVEVEVEQAGPLALVVAELVGNAIAHAFPEGRPGRVVIALGRQGDQGRLSVRDDGVGMPDAPELRRHSGLALAERLAAQLRGRLEVRRGGGTEVVLTFPLNR
ncbi:sensor histidine kinase [Falsiroseomonas sp. CW058]|uniref:sensor histidine kinase n=1 Tax=Falsiroseomonas sp. CW058 TaxID=3388664 RepID=UPI003D312D76